jgi:biopolymer transport protein ExbD
LIDIVFLLIIFFMLVSQFASQEVRPLDLPKPHESQFSEDIKPENRAVVQILFADNQDDSSEVLYYVGRERVDDLDQLGAFLRSQINRNSEFRVVVRADRRLEYDVVSEVMSKIAEAKVPEMFLTAFVRTEGDREG